MDMTNGYWDDRGVTLIELITVVSIILVLVVAAGFEYQGWIGRYEVEGEAKKMYGDFMEARTRAIAKSRVHFINLPSADSRLYAIYNDTDGSFSSPSNPDGDGILNTTADEMVRQQATRYEIDAPAGHFAISPKGIITDGEEALSAGVPIILVNGEDVDPDYNCLELTATRINMGFWNGTDCSERE